MVSWPVVAGRQREEKWAREPGTFCGFIILYSSRTAEPVAILPDGIIQHLRVGAAAGVGTNLLARQDAETLGMLGSGGMAREYLAAFRLIRPIRRVRVFSPTVANRERYAQEMSARHGIEVTSVGDPREAVRGADIVALCVSSIERVFETDWLEPGMHVTDVTTPSTPRDFPTHVDVAAWNGSPTLVMDPPPDDATYARGGTLSWVAGTPDELAQIPRVPLNPALLALPTVADVLAGKAPGRTSPEQTSFFHNQGRQGQLLAALSGVAYEAARARGVGLEIPTDWFLEDVRD
jgi:ornithine cyclodeaminase/alanine dehydrogenase-like protein (mu-crystallin family)